MAKKQSTALTNAEQGDFFLPADTSHLASQNEGFEHLDAADYVTPRIKLLQSGSPEILENHTLKPGEFYHTISKTGLGSSLKVCIVHVNKSIVLWNPQRKTGEVLARSNDTLTWDKPHTKFEVELKTKKKVIWDTKGNVAESGLADWGSSDPEDPNSKPAAALNYNLALVLTDFVDLSPAILIATSSKIKPLRRVLTELKSKKYPLYGIEVELFAEQDEGPEGIFFNIGYKPVRGIPAGQLFDFCKSQYEFFSSSGLVLSEKDLKDEEPAEVAVDSSKY